MTYIKTGIDQPGIVELLFYKGPTGKALANLAQTLLHGPSNLTPGERELIASYVSNLNNCEYCHESHSASANFHLKDEGQAVNLVRVDPVMAPVSEKMKALLKIAGRVQKSGREVTISHIEAARHAGASDEDIHDAVLIAAAFCMYNRYVDGLGTRLPADKEEYIPMGKRMATIGYKYPPLFSPKIRYPDNESQKAGRKIKTGCCLKPLRYMKKKDNQIFKKTTVAFIFIIFLASPSFLALLSNKSVIGRQAPAREAAIKKYGFFLEEVSKQSGVNFVHHSPRLDPRIDPILPIIASTGASVSVCDFDRDGWNDFYVTNSRFGTPNALYHNEHNGTFTDVAEKMGVAFLNRENEGVSMGAVWADYDNDGYEDLFVYKWGKPELFKNENGKRFINVTAQSGLPGWINSNTAIWFDYNSDGLVDLFIGGYFREDIDLWHLKSTNILTESFEYSQNGGRNYLFKNNGNGTFEDVTFKTGLTSTRWTYAAGALDVDGDGYPELIIANDYANAEFYQNEKGQRFVEKSNENLIGLSPKSGMNVSFGDAYNRGQLGFYISNITEEGVLLQGNNFWVPLSEKGKILYANEARENGTESGGWSYGAQFGDLNNDGFSDLYVANGFVSGKKGTSYWYDYSKVTGGNSAIISDIKNWPDMKGRSQSGYQQNRIYLNNGSGHFQDVAKFVSDSESLDSRAVAFADLWNRGVLDVIVSNQNNRLAIYKNHTDPKNNWIAFELEGIRTNRSAIGATVELFWNNKRQLQVITGGVGFCAQNQRRLQFGMGRASVADSAVIRWPNGIKQVMRNPEVNRVNQIIESK